MHEPEFNLVALLGYLRQEIFACTVYIDDAFAHDPMHFVYEEAYNGYLNWLQNLTATMPYMVSPGNHESECHIAQCLIHTDK